MRRTDKQHNSTTPPTLTDKLSYVCGVEYRVDLVTSRDLVLVRRFSPTGCHGS